MRDFFTAFDWRGRTIAAVDWMSDDVLCLENEIARQHTGGTSYDGTGFARHAPGWGLLCCLVLCLLPMQKGLASESAGPDFRLSAHPSICVSYDSAAPCTMALELQWQSSASTDVCLREAGAEEALRCWTASRAGRLELEYANTEDVLYQLVAAGDLSVLAEAEIKIINRDLRSSRKRRRHVWSIL